MLKNTKRKIFEYIDEKIESKLEAFKKLYIHTHKEFVISSLRDLTHGSIDEMVNNLQNETFRNKKDIELMRAELNWIHTDYRNKLCNNCCHKEICKDSQNVRYGYECKNKICIINLKKVII